MNFDYLPMYCDVRRHDWIDVTLLEDLGGFESMRVPSVACEDKAQGHSRTAGNLSRLLLKIYANAHEVDIGQFERVVLDALRVHIAFDAAWTGRGTMALKSPVPHNNYLEHLPRTFIEDWMEVRYEDPLAMNALQATGHAKAISTTQSDLSAGFRSFGEKYALAHMINVDIVDPKGHLVTFLSLYRYSSSSPFSTGDAFFIETLIPHLQMARELNRLHHLTRASKTVEQPVALCDSFGALHNVEFLFLQDLRLEWPEWNSKSLPTALVDHLRYRHDVPYLGTHIGIQVRSLAGLFLLKSAARSCLDALSPRERRVLDFYSEGLTYKQVARKMQIAPTTVRHHLRNAYKKLGVSNRGQLYGVLGPKRGA